MSTPRCCPVAYGSLPLRNFVSTCPRTGHVQSPAARACDEKTKNEHNSAVIEAIDFMPATLDPRSAGGPSLLTLLSESSQSCHEVSRFRNPCHTRVTTKRRSITHAGTGENVTPGAFLFVSEGTHGCHEAQSTQLRGKAAQGQLGTRLTETAVRAAAPAGGFGGAMSSGRTRGARGGCASRSGSLASHSSGASRSVHAR